MFPTNRRRRLPVDASEFLLLRTFQLAAFAGTSLALVRLAFEAGHTTETSRGMFRGTAHAAYTHLELKNFCTDF